MTTSNPIISRPSKLRTAAMLSLMLLLIAAAGCSEDTEYKQSFGFILPVDLDGKFGSDAAGSTASIDYTDIEHLYNVKVDMADGNPDLKAAADGGELDELSIDQISFTVTENSASIAIPATEIFVGPEGINTVTDEAILIGTIPEIPAGETASGVATLEPANFIAAGQYIFPLTFGIVTRTKTSVAAGETVPGGKISVTLDVQLTMFAEE